MEIALAVKEVFEGAIMLHLYPRFVLPPLKENKSRQNDPPFMYVAPRAESPTFESQDGFHVLSKIIPQCFI